MEERKGHIFKFGRDVSPEARDVYSEILINLAWVLIVSLPDYIVSHSWWQLTTSFILTIIAIRVAILLRKK